MTGQSPAQNSIGGFAPMLAELTDDVLFDDIWDRPAMSKRERSLVEVSSLITSSSFEQLTNLLRLASQNGLIEE